MFNHAHVSPASWLAFELNVLRRLKFQSVALTLAGEPSLGAALKRWNVRVSANEATRAAWTKAVAEIENNSERLTGDDISAILEDAYVPRHQLKNQSLKKWFNETDAWWFDNVRQNVEKIASPVKQAIALKIGMGVGDYVLSFADETRELRQPLSEIFRRLYLIEPNAFDNNQKNPCTNKIINEFIAESYSDLMFLRLPPAHNLPLKKALGRAAWREEWIRGRADFWTDLEAAQTGKLGAHVAAKSQYLHLVEDALQTAAHVSHWAIAHVENGFVSASDIAEIVNRVRRVETVFTKDFSELTGTKAVIITA